ncbi:MAG TPA: NAD-dependent epimerase/dehydratase family protein [Propionibacteriaceae bacterium]|nr:NAD-dependent epimerase/dehydratase family protein [Propionibacteriaceae bacterium]
MKVLLTGGAGFIGRPVHDQLIVAGHVVQLFDRTLDPRDDITDHDRLWAAARDCEAVIHLAAKVGLGVDIRDIDEYALHNDYGTAMVLRVAAEHAVSRFVYASSMVVYGEGSYRCARHGSVSPPPRHRDDLDSGRFDPRCPQCGEDLIPELVSESAPLDPRNSYAATKVHGEQLAAIWSRETGGEVAALRFHNVYGPGMPRDTPYAGVASIFADCLLRGEPPQVFEDGCQRRNFIHVSDVAAAVLAALHAKLPVGLTPLNIGTPWVVTVGEMATELSRALGGPAPVVTGAYRLGDVRHITADCSAAERVLGWRARIDLATGRADLSARVVARAATGADKSE